VVQPDIGDGRGDEQRELHNSCHVLWAVRGIKPDRRLHPLVVGRRPRHRRGRRHCSAHGLDDALGRDVPRAPIHDVEPLLVPVSAGVGVRVAGDCLQHPLGVLELYLLVLVILWVHLLLALLLSGRCTILALLLLLLLTDLLCELLDFKALLGAVAPGVVHQAFRTALIAVRWLMWALVTTWAMTPTYRCNCNGGSTSQRLVLAAGPLLLLLFATALGSSVYVMLVSLRCFWSRL
jgi:hypothetical protein